MTARLSGFRFPIPAMTAMTCDLDDSLKMPSLPKTLPTALQVERHSGRFLKGIITRLRCLTRRLKTTKMSNLPLPLLQGEGRI